MESSNAYVQLDPAVIEQARRMDLFSYLQQYEPSNLKRVAWNVYCTREHDRLKIRGGKWYWVLRSRGFGGGLAAIIANLPAAINRPFSITVCEDSLRTILIFCLPTAWASAFSFPHAGTTVGVRTMTDMSARLTSSLTAWK